MLTCSAIKKAQAWAWAFLIAGTGDCRKFEPGPEGILPYVESLLRVRKSYLAVAAGLLV